MFVVFQAALSDGPLHLYYVRLSGLGLRYTGKLLMTIIIITTTTTTTTTTAAAITQMLHS